MKKRSKKSMFIVIGIFLCAGIVITFLKIPYSSTEIDFRRNSTSMIDESDHQEDVFSEKDIADLPTPVQRYFRYCGYIGTRKMTYIEIEYQDVDFVFGDKPIKIDYIQYNFVNRPNRIAYIDSSMYGIPFEGLDVFLDGAGAMKGVIAKLFTLFNQTGDAMDQSSQVTFLSEILFVPSAAIQEYVEWEAIDDLHAKAKMSYYGRSVSGIFTFDENGEMLSFETDDRSVIGTDGSSKPVKWLVVLKDYMEVDGIRKPTVFQAVWHYADGNLVYFNGKGTVTEYV